MKSDRELLELAAKAAGIHIDKGKSNGGPTPSTGFDLAGNVVLDWHKGTTWNPLTDDGDAMRLAVKLRLTINPYLRGVFVSRNQGEPVTREEWGNDDAGTTRRAIVRAAAAMGGETL